MSTREELEFSAEAKLSNQNANLVGTTPAEYASALEALTTDELRALRHLTDWDTDDHDGRFGHLPYPTYAEAKRILAHWDREN